MISSSQAPIKQNGVSIIERPLQVKPLCLVCFTCDPILDYLENHGQIRSTSGFSPEFPDQSVNTLHKNKTHLLIKTSNIWTIWRIQAYLFCRKFGFTKQVSLSEPLIRSLQWKTVMTIISNKSVELVVYVSPTINYVSVYFVNKTVLFIRMN